MISWKNTQVFIVHFINARRFKIHFIMPKKLYDTGCRFDSGVENGILWLEDLNGDKSLTDDPENALLVAAADNEISLADLPSTKIMYKDSMGNWDGVKASVRVIDVFGKNVVEVSGVNFFPLNSTDFEMAQYRLLAFKAKDNVKLN
jgi:hypothetical protein